MPPRAGWERREGGPFGYCVYLAERGGFRFTGVVRRLAKGGRVEFFVRRISFRPFPLSVVVVRGETLLSVPAARRLVEAICREDAP